ncbi:MAG: hypothetical protein LUE20_03740 [Oscillospiraceae bacterium]|nr:hypothetical protein [Oscillospiraceae bacterium]
MDEKQEKRICTYARTPGGMNLGERVIVNGEWMLRHKGTKRYEYLSPEIIVECISGRKVDHIVYKTASQAENVANG